MKTPSMIPISRSTCDPCLPKAWNALSPEETESVPEEYIHKDDRKRHVLRDLFTASFPNYCRAHQVPEYKLRVMNSLISCKTGKLGYSLIRCDTCGRTEMHAGSGQKIDHLTHSNVTILSSHSWLNSSASNRLRRFRSFYRSGFSHSTQYLTLALSLFWKLWTRLILSSAWHLS